MFKYYSNLNLQLNIVSLKVMLTFCEILSAYSLSRKHKIEIMATAK